MIDDVYLSWDRVDVNDDIPANDDYTPHQVTDGTSNVGEVTVKGPGVTISRPVDEATMSSIIALLFGGAPSLPGGRSPGGGGGTHGTAGRVQGGGVQQSSQWDDELTLGEFIRETQANSFPQKICAAGYYLTNMQGAESFSRDDVRTALVNAHEDLPGNYPRDWSKAASSHLIAAKPGESGQFYVPKTGRTAVESHFQDVPRRRPGRRTGKRSATPNGDTG